MSPHKFSTVQLEIKKRHLERLGLLIQETKAGIATWQIIKPDNQKILNTGPIREVYIRVDGNSDDALSSIDGKACLSIRVDEGIDIMGFRDVVFIRTGNNVQNPDVLNSLIESYILLVRPFEDDPEILDRHQELINLIDDSFSGTQ